MVFRKPVKQLARRKVVFNDKKGIYFHGMWCATLNVEEENEEELPAFNDSKEIEETAKLPAIKELQAVAKMSAVAIPLSYIIGRNHKDSNKFCVITNWWKYRMADGTYQLPTLDPKLYGARKDKFDIDKMFKKATKEASKAPRNGKQPQTGII